MKKLSKLALTLAIITAMGTTAVVAFAAEAVDMNSILETAFTGMVADVLSGMGVIIPIALGVFGALFAAKMGMKMFKSFAGVGTTTV